MARPETLSVVDRAKAMAVLAAHWGGPWARQMLRRAYRLLGEVMRVGDLVVEVMDHVMASTPASRMLQRRVLVAGALLGIPRSLEHARRLAFDSAYSIESGYDISTAALVAVLVTPELLSAEFETCDEEQRFDDLRR